MADFWERKTPLQKTKFILGFILIILLIVFAIANWQTTEFDLIFTRVEMPRTILIVGCVVLGYIIAAFTEGLYKKKREKSERKSNEITTDIEDSDINKG